VLLAEWLQASASYWLGVPLERLGLVSIRTGPSSRYSLPLPGGLTPCSLAPSPAPTSLDPSNAVTWLAAELAEVRSQLAATSPDEDPLSLSELKAESRSAACAVLALLLAARDARDNEGLVPQPFRLAQQAMS
jgi:hypothetical protein